MTKSKAVTKIEELQARRSAESSKRAKWLPKTRRFHEQPHEMVDLTKDSILANLPAELHLDVISYLDFNDVLEFRRTCRYFRFFINESVVEESKANQIAEYHAMETTKTVPSGHLPCYTCLKMRPESEFYDMSTYTARGRYTRVIPLSAAVPKTRHCIRCGFLDHKYDPGVRLNTNGRSWVVCAQCGRLEDTPASSTSGLAGPLCEPCYTQYDFLCGLGGLTRAFQCLLAIIIFPLACHGKAMPWSSKPSDQSLRFIFTLLIDFLTLGGTCVSLVVRCDDKTYPGYENKRTSNGRFVFLVEFSAFLWWSAVLGALFHEAVYNKGTGRYDRSAKALTAMECLIAVTFLFTTLWSNSFTLNRFVRRRWRRPDCRYKWSIA